MVCRGGFLNEDVRDIGIGCMRVVFGNLVGHLSLVQVISTRHGAPTGLKHMFCDYPGLTPGATNVPPLWGSFLGRFCGLIWVAIFG